MGKTSEDSAVIDCNSDSDVIIVALHENFDRLNECVDLINSEWPRSRTLRRLSLEKSSKNFPVSLLLSSASDVLGHARLCKIPGRPLDAWIETVVVTKTHRGRGYGRKLMHFSEEFAVKHGFKTLYLSTHDKQDFYAHLGYEPCQPVCTLGASAYLLEGEQFKKLRDSFCSTFEAVDVSSKKHKHSSANLVVAEANLRPATAQPAPSPPPPPPVPCVISTTTPQVTFMCKVLI